MKKRGGKNPFFVAWVENAELLGKSRAGRTAQAAGPAVVASRRPGEFARLNRPGAAAPPSAPYTAGDGSRVAPGFSPNLSPNALKRD
jgi:hypothetical protein